eukprot:CAMPEP_0119368508 /NCGR_PEP_ID=MMETSP1334-20130426/15152_1 /TAXON_ID=127549 /ORGANISM="Calcidiscus leptoporus, Strain RCC1130" /LENGTH=77 /DNA_ID=CAMNT_0007385159 /DNA_START=83 /DNA_END=316 /DNA_ORIENTATION=+
MTSGKGMARSILEQRSQHMSETHLSQLVLRAVWVTEEEICKAVFDFSVPEADASFHAQPLCEDSAVFTMRSRRAAVL